MTNSKSEWTYLRLSEIADVIMGQSPKSKFYNENGDGLPFFQGCGDFSEIYPIPKKWCTKPLKVAIEHDVLMSVRAPVGDLNLANQQCIIGRGLCALRPKMENDRFLYYLMKGNVGNLISLGTGSVYDSVNKSTIENFGLKVPPVSLQRKIASILSAYDDLIENNTRRIKILEEMAQAVYKEWFVNFRFPGHEKVKMVDSELGKIPEGWKVKEIRDFGEVVTGKTPSTRVKENYGHHMQFIKTPDMHGNIYVIKTSQYLSELGTQSQKSKTLPENTLCVSCIGTAGIVSITSQPSQTNQQINSIVLEDVKHLVFLFFALKNLREKINLFGGTGATMVNLNKEKFSSLRVFCPDSKLLDLYHAFTSPMFDEIKNLQMRAENLRYTRDLLLPKLVRGEINLETLEIDIEDTKNEGI